jgi:tetratricopeptide (TPR) repeat protein
MRPFAAIFLFTLVSAASSGEEIDIKRKAKAHFTAGTALFEAGEYGRAIEEYGETYRLFPVPDLLFNLGQAHRLSGNAKAAADFYIRYLAVRPTGLIADEAREHLREVSVAASEAARTVTSPAKPASTPHAAAQSPVPPPSQQSAAQKAAPPPNKKHWAWDDAAMVEVGADGKTVPSAASVEKARAAASKNPDKPKKRRWPWEEDGPAMVEVKPNGDLVPVPPTPKRTAVNPPSTAGDKPAERRRWPWDDAQMVEVKPRMDEAPRPTK